MSRWRLLTALGLTLLAAGTLTPGARAGGPAGAGRAGPGLAGVRSASLRQRGRPLVWRVSLVHGFSVSSLGTGRRSVCLVLERRTSDAPDGRLCLAPGRSAADAAPSRPAGARAIELTFERLHRTAIGPGRRVAGKVRRTGSRTVTASFMPAALGRGYRTLRWQVLSTARGGSCPRAGGGPPTCALLFPAHRHPLARLHVPKLVGCVAHGPAIVYGGSPARREVALTFDDGPWNDPPTMDFVDELHRLDAPATFFEIGDQISEYDPTGAIERAMLGDGDMIGDHTWTHPDMDALPPAAQTSELELTAHAIRAATGFTPCLWRPPYGSIDPEMESLARGLGFLTIYWNDDPRDWSLPGVAAIVHTALAEARNGSIVEMHFGGGPREETLAAIPEIVQALRARGDRLVNLATMLGVREIWH